MLIFTIVLFSIQFIGCASSRPKTEEKSETKGDEDDLGEIERLLGISSEDKQQKKEPKSDDDLLTLLKADEDKGTTKTPTTSQGTPGDPRLSKLQEDVSSLENQLVEKNRTIADLKAQVMMKEEELKSYRSGQKSMPSQSSIQPSTQYYASGSSSSGKSEYERSYDQGLDLFHTGQYRDAMSIFESILAQNRNHNLSDNAQYWIGECYYALGNYRAAILAFEKVFTFNQSNKNDYAQYKLGQCYQKLGDNERAREEFQNLIDNYTNAELINRAHEKLAQLQ